MQRTNTAADAYATGEVELDVGAGLRARIPLGKQRYTIDETAGRVVKAWDYINGRDQVIYSDTGLRRITHADVTAGTLSIRREGNTVYFYAQAIALANTGTVVISAVIPVGFRASTFVPVASLPYWSSEVSRRARCTGPDLQFQSVGSSDIQNLVGIWDTNDPWPTTLPGTAIGSIPV